MRRHLAIAIATLFFSSAIAGCVYVPKSPNEPVSVEYYGGVNASQESGLEMNGYATSNGNQENMTFEDVYVCVYDENGTLMELQHLGDLNREHLNVSISTKELPKYIIPESEDIWQDGVMTRGLRLEQQDFYATYTVYETSERFGEDGPPSGVYQTCRELELPSSKGTTQETIDSPIAVGTSSTDKAAV